MAVVSDNIFSKCLPSFSVDFQPCGSLTLCNLLPANASTLESYFYDTNSSKFKVFGALIMAEFEMSACGVEQNGLFDLIMALRQDYSKRVNWTSMEGGLYEIKPFVMGRRKTILNNEYWTVSNGTTNGENWQVDVVSQTGVPADDRWFNPQEQVFIFGRSAGGTTTETAWKIVSRTTLSSIAVRLVLASLNSASLMPSSKIGNPTTGYLIRGVGNISDYESWCYEGPGLNLNQNAPFWVGTTRFVTCEDELFNKWRSALVRENAYFREFKDVDSVERNRQLGNDFKRRFVNSFFYSKPLSNQTLAGYQSLETITAASTGNLSIPGEGKCIGYRAQPIGVIEQLWECQRGADLQGQPLNLPEFFNNILYDIYRVRNRSGDGRYVIESITDSYFAAQIQLAMVNYFNYISGGKIQYTMPVNPDAQNSKLGFWYRKYQLIYPNVEWRVLSHPFFDDQVEAARQAGIEATGRVLWTLDWSDIELGVLESNRRVQTIGDIEKLGAIDSGLACVMKFPKNTYNMMSTTHTYVVRCPRKHFVLRNIAGTLPEHEAPVAPTTDYYGVYNN